MNTRLVVDFEADPAACSGWQVINDVVMGGRSAAQVATESAGLVFAGEVSLANGGGFASVRSPARDWGLAGSQGLRLRVQGDEQRYQLRLRYSERRGEPAYVAWFEPKAGAEGQVIDLCWADFVPRLRGRAVEMPPLSPEQVRHLGFLIAEKQAGPFRLVIQQLWVLA